MHQSFVRKKLFLPLCLFAVISISGCELTQNYLKHDREENMEPQDYRDALAPRIGQNDTTQDDLSGGRIPQLQPYVAQSDGNYKAFPLVSISVNQSIPLRDVLYEIAGQAQYDVELDPRIEGSIIFSARNRPLDMVIDRIAEIAGLRYKFEDDMLRVEIDTPYHEIYKINYLALTRTNNSSITNDISIVANATEGGNTQTGSSFSATNESVIDFWTELEENLTQILTSNRDAARLATENDPRVTVADVNPAPVQPIVMDDEGNIVEDGPNVQVAPPDAVLNVEELPVEDEGPSAASDDPFAARFSVNRQAGLVSVFAPERIHEQIAQYMTELKRSVTAQVLVEAKVLEVSLNDEFSTGVDWNLALDDLDAGIGFGPQTAGGFVRGLLDLDGSLPSNTNFNYASGDFNIAVDALSRFGTVQALASPRLTVLNNQSAALNVARNVVYFEIDTEVTTGDVGAAVESFESEARTVPEGVLINVQPAIDLDRELISMAIRPTVTSIVDFTNDPNPSLAGAGVTSPIPVVNVQEFDSVIQMNNGQAVILGGLIQDRTTSTRNAVPVLGEIPMFGGLFRNQEDSIQKTELVVFLRATIVDHGSSIHATDKDLYRSFSSDRRPLKM